MPNSAISPGPVPRPGILDIAVYVGGEAKIAGVDRVIRLASNEGALGPSPRAVAAYESLAADLHRYPDGGSHALRMAIARHFGLEPENIVCGNGSDELIGNLVRAYVGPGDEVLYSEHGFMMYPIAAKSVGATPVKAPERNLTTDVDALLASISTRTRMVFLANPNNPTGTYLPAEEVARLHAGLPSDVLLVIDAAYAEYVNRNDYEPGIELVRSHPNVVMTRTFSKIFALGGMRVGWAYCPPAVADVMNRLRGPFNVNAAAQAAGVAALEDVGFTDRSRAHNDVWLPWTTKALEALGLTVTPSVGNFILVRFKDEPDRSADAAWNHMQSRGILTRKMGGYGLPDCLRITIGTESEMRAVVAALAELLDRR
ncbi:MAG TPA: histidinol-phosphate transaminase [Stellaceae bacterium]|nr:histidinol-phosphate transaminase [Stellaceae bacterium]